jgi:hypothetical protein
MQTYKFQNRSLGAYDVWIKREKYNNGRICLRIVDAEDGIPLFTATYNKSDETLESGETIIKDHSENKGVLKFLQDNGIVGPVKRTIESGYVELFVVDLLT